MKPGLVESIGKTLAGAVGKEGQAGECQLFLIFTDGTHLEFYGSGFHVIGSPSEPSDGPRPWVSPDDVRPFLGKIIRSITRARNLAVIGFDPDGPPLVIAGCGGQVTCCGGVDRGGAECARFLRRPGERVAFECWPAATADHQAPYPPARVTSTSGGQPERTAEPPRDSAPAQVPARAGAANGTAKRPAPPEPEDFGLSQDRLALLRQRLRLRFRWYAAAYAVGALSLAAGRVREPFAAAVLIPLAIAAALVLVNVVWRRRQADHRSYVQFAAAAKEYPARLCRWLRGQESWWQTLGGRRFEIELAALLAQRGFRIRWTGGAGDGGIDMVLEQDGHSEIIVQCKAHLKPVGPGPVRDLYGAMLDRGAWEAWLIATHGFTHGAREFASGKSIRLLSISDVLLFAAPAPRVGSVEAAKPGWWRRG